MNTTIMSGNITRDVEIQALNGGYSRLKFSIANNDEYDKRTSTNVTSFFDCEYLTKNPDTWIRKLSKGSAIVIQGTLKQEQWETDGQKRSKVVINVSGFPMNLASKNEMEARVANNAPPVPQAQNKVAPPAQAGSVASSETFEDDTIPF